MVKETIKLKYELLMDTMWLKLNLKYGLISIN